MVSSPGSKGLGVLGVLLELPELIFAAITAL